MTRRSVLRLLDANANRALEGLRVCEDIVRFHLGWAALYRRLRALRHAIAAAVNRLPVSRMDLIRARASRQDVGRTASSARVESLERLLAVNFQRAKESLRTLEECARLMEPRRRIAPRHHAAFQRLRFRVYDTERAVLLKLAAVRHP